MKFGYEYSGRLALDISSRVDFMGALTYPPDNMPGWCIAGSKVSVWNRCLMVRIRCGRQRPLRIYRKTGNLRAVQLLLGHTKLESTVRYLGIEVDDALQIAEQIEL